MGLRPIGTKRGEDGSIKFIGEPTTLYERTPGAGERTLRAGVAELEEAARRAGEEVEIVVRRQPERGRTFGFSKRDPRSAYLNEDFPKFDPSSID